MHPESSREQLGTSFIKMVCAEVRLSSQWPFDVTGSKSPSPQCSTEQLPRERWLRKRCDAHFCLCHTRLPTAPSNWRAVASLSFLRGPLLQGSGGSSECLAPRVLVSQPCNKDFFFLAATQCHRAGPYVSRVQIYVITELSGKNINPEGWEVA